MWPARAAAALLVLSLPAGGVTPAGASPEYDGLAAGETVITAQGTGGALLDVPSDAWLSFRGAKLELEAGTFAFAMISPSNCQRGTRGNFCGHQVYRVPASVWFDWSHHGDGAVEEGRLEIYIVSDGAVTLTLTLKGLTGRAEAVAERQINGEFQDLGNHCPVGDCENFGYGGAAREVRGPAFVSVVAYAHIPRKIPVINEGNIFGTTTTIPCVYPSGRAPKASADPNDHPTGCDMLPDPNDPFGHEWEANATQAVLRTSMRDIGEMSWAASDTADGMTYAGYWAEQTSPATAGGGGHGAYAVWLERGMS